MNLATLIVVLLALVLGGYALAYNRARRLSSSAKLHSLPQYYGYLTALWCGVPSLLLLLLWISLEPTVMDTLLVKQLPLEQQALPAEKLSLIVNEVKLAAATVNDTTVRSTLSADVHYLVSFKENSTRLRNGLIFLLLLVGGFFSINRISATLRPRLHVEGFVRALLLVCAAVAIVTTIGIVLSVLFESMRFFSKVPVTEFLFGTEWSPQTAIRADQVGGSGTFGAIPLFIGTLLISSVAMLVAVPLGLMSAIYLSEYASREFRTVAKPVLEILAGIPTVVYGFFAALTVAPLIRGWGESLGLDVASESALAAGLVMGVMIIPFVSSISDDVIAAVPQSLRDGSLAMGATRSETIIKVVLPASLHGIVSGILLAVSRAIGETMIVVMAAGLAANLTINPLEAVTTVTVQIVTLLTGDQEFDSAKTLAAFALGLLLFITTLILNIIALHVVRKYREQYE